MGIEKMDSLRAETGIKRIEVNDDGEYIQFSVTDNEFFVRFSDFIKWLEGQEQALSDISEEQKKITDENGELNINALDKVLSMRSEISKQACEKIDAIFGVDACKKIFCGITPDLFAISDFLEKVTPFIEKYAKERGERINLKYNRNRKGARSK